MNSAIYRSRYIYTKCLIDGVLQEWFKGFNIHNMNATYTAGRGAHTHNVKEVFINNYGLVW